MENSDESKLLHDKSKQWLPHSVSWYENELWSVIKKSKSVENGYKIRKNIAYNLQYLEYLDQTLKQLALTSVLIVNTWKSYIISATSIIEAIFYYLLKSREANLKKEWIEVERRTTNHDQTESEPTRMVVVTERLTHAAVKTDIKFNQLSARVEKNKLLGDTAIYSKVNALRKLRNKIHLFTSEDPTQMDTDFNAFNKSDYLLAKEILGEVLLKTNIFTRSQIEELGILDPLPEE